ncbi:MAG TPA: RDD family protein [Puia sp.]|nr:RDD family protein [Puia sp.]
MEKDLLTEDDIPQDYYPLLLDRVQSIFIDLILIVALMFVFAALLDDDAPNWIRIVLFFGIWAVYEPLLVIFGCTLGQYVKKIRVRDHADPSRRINIIQAFFRYLIKAALGWFSFLTISFNPEKRAIHDFVSGSIMVKVK